MGVRLALVAITTTIPPEGVLASAQALGPDGSAAPAGGGRASAPDTGGE
ncbi:hypothetical protein [Actinomadura chibensis]|nr:hypothetical protein [Actinomadura chibensis]